ncbi:MAG: hypothetical protein ACOX75_07660 [Lachnospiraceae bacterium]|jgi:hypothetical protein
MSEIKVNELLQLSKIGSALRKRWDDEETRRVIITVLICIGAALVLGIAAYIIYRVVTRYDDDFDLYDDLDYYYEDPEEEPGVADEEDFAE